MAVLVGGLTDAFTNIPINRSFPLSMFQSSLFAQSPGFLLPPVNLVNVLFPASKLIVGIFTDVMSAEMDSLQ